ncbi:MAG: VapC toxin family PIN domain ribonuclease [Verrucomicrobia bacterium]|nr:VapC toxin family PIN domain ribonuclease [Verrucomicrobiota bacterium]MDA1069472.1 VapC toxin family PIN domain ribonuclease [Verrucomicrobiota bacterium]
METALIGCAREGQMVVPTFVLAEIGIEAMPAFLKSWNLEHVGGSVAAALDAGKVFSQYLDRGGKPGRIIADFIIGAHARHHADRLLTRDAGFLRDYFKKDMIWLVD